MITKIPNNISRKKIHLYKRKTIAKGLGRYTTGLQINNVNITHKRSNPLRYSTNGHLNRNITNYMNIRYGCMESARIAVIRKLRKKRTINLENLKIQRSMMTKSKKSTRKSSRKSRKQKTLLIKSNLNYPATRKSLQVRQGKGVGSIHEWVQPLKASTILMEVSRAKVKLRKSYRLLQAASIKLPAKASPRFIYSRQYMRREMNFKSFRIFNTNNRFQKIKL